VRCPIPLLPARFFPRYSFCPATGVLCPLGAAHYSAGK
jgi:hypothetical protein